MPKSDFNKVTKQHLNHTLAWALSGKFAAYL